MVTDARIRDLKRKLVRGHRIILQEWVNKTDKDICRYLVLDDIVKYQEIPSSTPRYEIFNCNTYGFFSEIEEAEKKYDDTISNYANINLVTFRDAAPSFNARKGNDFDFISVKEMFACDEFKVDFFMIEPTAMMLLSSTITAFDNEEYTVNISFNFSGSNDVCVAPDFAIIDIVDSNGNLVVKHSCECDVDRIKSKSKKAYGGKYLINAIFLPKDYHIYASYDRNCKAREDFINKYNADPVYICLYAMMQAVPTIAETYNKKIKEGE
jgi:hypothetical protein